MAATTYTWNTIASSQTDGDSPLDETLMEGVRQNLVSLEEWMGDGYAQEKDHTHDGVNSALITELGGNSVSQSSMQDSAIGQAELKTTTSVVSYAFSSSNGESVIATGGMYILGWESKVTTGDAEYAVYLANGVLNTSYASYFGMKVPTGASRTVYVNHRYIQASPPYNLGNSDIPLFIYALVNNSTNKVEGTYIAEDPPWAYNGPKRINPHKVITRDRKKYLRRAKRPWSLSEAKADKTKLMDNLVAVKNSTVEEVEITYALKNAGMPDVPHPFVSHDPATHTVVLLDPCSPLCINLHEMAQDADEGVSEISELIYAGRVKFDNTHVNGLITPPGVMGVKMRLA